jgi:GntR family transcriptional regulator, carbon starvation induced regulator
MACPLEINNYIISEQFQLRFLGLTDFVEFNDKIGYRVAEITPYNVYDVFETFAKIENILFVESIQKGDDEWESNILACLYKLSKIEIRNNKTSYCEWFSRNEEFHSSLISANKSIRLLKIRNQCLAIKNWYINLAYSDAEEITIINNHNEHKRIAESAIARDKDSALVKLYNHNTGNIENLIIKLKIKKYLIQ